MKDLLKFKKEKFITFVVILLLALTLCGIFLKFHKITDTYWNIGAGYSGYKLEPLRDGRIINFAFLSIAESLHMPFKLYQFIMMAASIIFYSISVYLIYNEILDKIKNKNKINKAILLLGSFVMIFNPMTVEAFAYTETVMALSILFGTKAAILLKNNDIKSTIKSLLLVILMGICYQGTINFFITLSIFLFAVSGKHDIKSWIKQLIKIAIIAFITMAFMIIILNISNAFLDREQSRIGSNINIFNMIRGSIRVGINIITTTTFNLFPKYLITSFIMLGVILIGISIDKKENITLIYKYLFIVVVAVLSCTFPIFIQSGPSISARMSFSVGAIIGLTIVYVLLIQEKESKIINNLLLVISILAVAINLYDYISLGLMNIETQKMEKAYIEKINECIDEYERDSGISVGKVSITLDKNFNYTYSNLPNNTFTTRGILPHYSRIHTLNYYMNRKLKLVNMDVDIYRKYFENKDFEEFSEEQVKFKEDTVYICIY